MLRKTPSLVAIAVFTYAFLGCGGDSTPAPAERPIAVVSTSMGDIAIELFADTAPITVANFLAYADAGFYDGTAFHRVIPDFMVQGGGLLPDGTPKPTRDPIENEADNGFTNDRGTVAMARTAAPNSATSQFFINVKDNVFLNHSERNFGYAVFGKVIEGLEIADAISKVPTARGDAPVTPVLIESVRRR